MPCRSAARGVTPLRTTSALLLTVLLCLVGAGAATATSSAAGPLARAGVTCAVADEAQTPSGVPSGEASSPEADDDTPDPVLTGDVAGDPDPGCRATTCSAAGRAAPLATSPPVPD